MVSFTHAGRPRGLVITTARQTAESELHLVEVRDLIDGGMAHTQVFEELSVVFDYAFVVHTANPSRRAWII